MSRSPLHAVGRASIADETEGMVKVVSDKKHGEIPGVHIIGPHATELIAEAVFAMEMEATVEELATTIHPHPTLSEALKEAAMMLRGVQPTCRSVFLLEVLLCRLNLKTAALRF